ncbi:MAG: endolytic transglycosylase MltG [Acidobacteriota bacterium]
MTGSKRWIGRLLAALAACALLVLTGLSVLLFKPYKGFSEAEKLILIPRGTSSYTIAHQLQDEGVVQNWVLLFGYWKLLRKSPLQAGEYQFKGAASVYQVVEKLVRGLVYYHPLTIPEGYSLFEIEQLLKTKQFVDSGPFWTASCKTEWIADLAPDAKNLEGYLFPDTYRVTRGTTAEEILKLMVERFRRVVREQLEETVSQTEMTLKDVVTLASLIEEETSLDEERELISAVFHNRLRRRMPLQCDPTVIYAARLSGTYRGTIYQSDLEMDSPYNTYRRQGLPPGPIASPGLRSLQAAVNPAKVSYLYFVANNQGGHVFSETLAEHNRAVAAYRNGLRQESRKPNRKTLQPS